MKEEACNNVHDSSIMKIQSLTTHTCTCTVLYSVHVVLIINITCTIYMYN